MDTQIQKRPQIPLTPCQSARIQAHGFDPETRTLALQFKAENGPCVYHYSNVEPELYKALCEAASLGRFFSERINVKDEHGDLRYPYTKVAVAVPDDTQ